MLRKALLAAAVAVVALAVGRPASAHPRFVEPYGRIFQARSFICTPVDGRPKDALHAQLSDKDDPRQRFLVSPYFRDDKDTFYAGIGVAYANVEDEWHPWAVQASYFHGDFDRFAQNFDGWDFNAKYVLWQPADARLPVISVVGSIISFGHLGRRYDALIAIDQQITRKLYGTINAGWARADFDNFSHSAFQAGFGLTYIISPNVTLSADYIPRNAAEGIDTWSVAALWAIDRNHGLRVGGGKGNLVFGNYIYKLDW